MQLRSEGLLGALRVGHGSDYADKTGYGTASRERPPRACKGRGRTAFQAAEAGDETALAVCREYVDYLANGLSSLVNIIRPEIVAIGGGVAAAPANLLLEPLQEAVARESYSRHGGRVTRILPAELGNDAGIIGAAFLSRVQ